MPEVIAALVIELIHLTKKKAAVGIGSWILIQESLSIAEIEKDS